MRKRLLLAALLPSLASAFIFGTSQEADHCYQLDLENCFREAFMAVMIPPDRRVRNLAAFAGSNVSKLTKPGIQHIMLCHDVRRIASCFLFPGCSDQAAAHVASVQYHMVFGKKLPVQVFLSYRGFGKQVCEQSCTTETLSLCKAELEQNHVVEDRHLIAEAGTLASSITQTPDVEMTCTRFKDILTQVLRLRTTYCGEAAKCTCMEQNLTNLPNGWYDSSPMSTEDPRSVSSEELMQNPSLYVMSAQGWLLTKMLNVMLVTQFVIAIYFHVAYYWALCFHMLTSELQAVLYICIFEGIFLLSFWSLVATLVAQPVRVPDNYWADSKTDTSLKAVTPLNGKRYSPQISTIELLMAQSEILQKFCAERNIMLVEREHFGDRLRYCYDCGLVKPDRTHHCSSCGYCVVKFDHHCPWINNCVHFGNYKAFLLYLLYSLMFLAWTLISTLEGLVRYFINQQWSDQLIPFIMVCGLLLFSLIFMYWPLGEMFCYHRGLVVLNETTCEQAKIPRIVGDDKADYNMGTFNNLQQVFGWGYWFFPLQTQVIDGLHFYIRYRSPRYDCQRVTVKERPD